ncbi:hypothetical protein B0H19DRAFT_426731 [Mycena capillaripes]|nr:hypothetical protein B0H19DRAFT_426731 [Mycena capillaripes]
MLKHPPWSAPAAARSADPDSIVPAPNLLSDGASASASILRLRERERCPVEARSVVVARAVTVHTFTVRAVRVDPCPHQGTHPQPHEFDQTASKCSAEVLPPPPASSPPPAPRRARMRCDWVGLAHRGQARDAARLDGRLVQDVGCPPHTRMYTHTDDERYVWAKVTTTTCAPRLALVPPSVSSRARAVATTAGSARTLEHCSSPNSLRLRLRRWRWIHYRHRSRVPWGRMASIESWRLNNSGAAAVWDRDTRYRVSGSCRFRR